MEERPYLKYYDREFSRINETQILSLKKLNKNKSTSRHIIMKLQKTKDKKKILKQLERNTTYLQKEQMKMIGHFSTATVEAKR